MRLTLALSCLVFFFIPNIATARPRFEEIITVSSQRFGNVICGRNGDQFTLGKVDRRGRFSSTEKNLKKKIKNLEKSIKKATRRKKFEKVAQLTASRDALNTEIAQKREICRNRTDDRNDGGNDGGGESDDPNTGTPAPLPPSDDTPTPQGPPPASLEQFSGSVNRREVQILLEKAGFGLSNKEESLVQIASAQGIVGLVDTFMAHQEESEGLLARVNDRLDGELGEVTTQTPYGQRAGLFDLWIHTKNPYEERLALFLLSVWTVAGDVVEDETFRGAFWNYYNRLRDSAKSQTDIKTLGLEITRDPLMLIYLSNNQNKRGSPNENYARELMELFTLGTVNLDGAPNYTETRTDGSGDIAVAAKMLTGWRVRFDYTNNVLVPEYIPTRHENGPHTMFAGTGHQFVGESDADLVAGIFNNHPSVKNYYAKEILKEYLTPNPSRELIEALGTVLQQNGYRLRPALRTLFLSQAFYSPAYEDTIPKNSAEFAVGIVRVMKMEDAVDVNEAERALVRMGMAVNSAPSVFWFNPTQWTGASIAVERANFIAQILGDSTAQRQLSPAWTVQNTLPVSGTGAGDTANFVSSALSTRSINTNAYASLLTYMNTQREWDDTFSTVPYNSTNLEHQKQKGGGLYYLLAMMPSFQLK